MESLSANKGQVLGSHHTSSIVLALLSGVHAGYWLLGLQDQLGNDAR